MVIKKAVGIKIALHTCPGLSFLTGVRFQLKESSCTAGISGGMDGAEAPTTWDHLLPCSNHLALGPPTTDSFLGPPLWAACSVSHPTHGGLGDLVTLHLSRSSCFSGPRLGQFTRPFKG